MIKFGLIATGSSQSVPATAWGIATTTLLGGLLAALFTLIFTTLTVRGAVGVSKLFRSNRVIIPDVTVSTTPEQIDRGDHLAEVLCTTCHSLNGELPLWSGGKSKDRRPNQPPKYAFLTSGFLAISDAFPEKRMLPV